MIKIRCFLYTIFLSAFFCANGQDSLRFVSATTGAACQAIKKYDHYLVTGTGSTLRVYDISSGIPYVQVWEYRYKSVISDLLIKGHFLYVAANFDGMTKWDISIPGNPQKVYTIAEAPNSTDPPVLDVSVSNDTIFLARLSKMSAYKDLGTSCSFIADFGAVTGFGKIYGSDVKNGTIAFTEYDLLGQNGVYLYDTHTFSQIGFYHQTYCYPENVIWGKNNNLLHVLGGSNTINGYFYTLNVSNLANPQVIFADTIIGIPFFAIADAMNAENINDTIYVATQAGLKPNGPLDTTYIRVYDATIPSNIHLLGYLPAGLWHFDLTVDYPKYYVASEWYGILTGDLTGFPNGSVQGITRTGGWNLSSDKSGDYLVVGDEGYGLKLYNISDIRNPILAGVNNAGGFCSRVRFSSGGNYIYAAYMTTKGFRVFRNPSLEPVDSLSQFFGTGKMQVWLNWVYIENDQNNKLYILNVADPTSVTLQSSVDLQINDMLVSNGKLFISNNNDILVYDVTTGNLQQIASVSLAANQDAKAITVFGNVVYVYITNKGLVSYSLETTGSNWSLTEQNTWILANGEPSLMDADTFGIYLSYHSKGLFLYDRQTMTQKNYYRGELEYKGFTDQWGLQELYCRDKSVFLTEYFSQTTILSADNHFNLGIPDDQGIGQQDLYVYPNPFKDKVIIRFKAESGKEYRFELYNDQGKVVWVINEIPSGEIRIYRSNLPEGIYFFRILYKDNITGEGKLIAE